MFAALCLIFLYRVTYRAPLAYHSRGRPRLEISLEQLVYLHSMCFTWRDRARILGVSPMTIFRRRQELHLAEEPTISITDEELHDLMCLTQLARNTRAKL